MKKFVPLLFATIVVAGCATNVRHEASGDILALANALRDRNLSEIEAHIDKRALKYQAMQIAREVAIEEGARRMGNSMGAQVAAVAAADLLNPVIEALATRAVEPDALAYFARSAGLSQQTQMPSRTTATFAIKAIDNGRVCVPDNHAHCVLYFNKFADRWRLAGVDDAVLRAKMRSFAPR